MYIFFCVTQKYIPIWGKNLPTSFVESVYTHTVAASTLCDTSKLALLIYFLVGRVASNSRHFWIDFSRQSSNSGSSCLSFLAANVQLYTIVYDWNCSFQRKFSFMSLLLLNVLLHSSLCTFFKLICSAHQIIVSDINICLQPLHFPICNNI